MPKVTVNEKYCKGCRLCVAFCPKGALVMSKRLGARGLSPAEVADDSVCTGCMSCAVVCPDAAIEIIIEEKKGKAVKADA